MVSAPQSGEKGEKESGGSVETLLFIHKIV
jgi:hypothetical protein